MMKYLFCSLFCLCALATSAQSLRDINYNYLYNPAETFTFDLKAVRQADRWTVLYKLQLRDTSFAADDFTIQWEFRQTLAEKESTPAVSIEVKESLRNKSSVSGTITLPAADAPNILVGKVINNSAKRAWVYYKVLEPNYPINGQLIVNGKIYNKPFVDVSDKIEVTGDGSKVISYYNDNFPAAPPPFAESQSRVPQQIKTDSTFFISAQQEIVLPMTGLYLVQSDTNSAEGFAFRVEEDYPRFSYVSSLAGPLMYICTRDEVNRLVNARNDKRAFDRIILSITNDTDRARKLIRNYFKRVELANQFFTSYKEGWKTDRGMIYIIFGLPDEVFRFNDREVWNYDNDFFKITFNFSKSSSIFDPDNYVLIRERKYRETWLETIDLWRGARF